MARAVRIAAIALFAGWLAWNVYRHIAVYLVRGRIVVVTDRVLGNLVLGSTAIAVASVSFPTDVVVFLVGIAVAAAIWRTEVWFLFGATRELVLERGALVLRGMGFRFEETTPAALQEREGRILITFAASPSRRTHVLRLQADRGINKVALFRANFRKYLVAIPRERR